MKLLITQKLVVDNLFVPVMYKEWDQLGNELLVERYNRSGKLICKETNGHQTTYKYDDKGLLIHKERSDGTFTTYEYLIEPVDFTSMHDQEFIYRCLSTVKTYTGVVYCGTVDMYNYLIVVDIDGRFLRIAEKDWKLTVI
jgi:YD repeat-containing protein